MASRKTATAAAGTTERPQGLAEIVRRADSLTATVDGLVQIESREQAQRAGQFLRVVRESIRDIKARYVDPKKKQTEALNAVRDMEKEDLAPWEAADKRLSAPLLAFKVAEDVAAEERRKQELREAEERAKADRERTAEQLRAAAAQASSASESKALTQQARMVEKSPVLITDAPAPEEKFEIEGVAVPKRKVAEIVDVRLLVRAIANGKVPMAAIKGFDQKFLDSQANHLGADLNYPGVIVRDKHNLSARGL